MIVVQLGPSATTGNIVVTVNRIASNPLPFAIRSGNIYFVATSGNDSNPGSFAQPWRTIVKPKDTIAPVEGVTIDDTDGPRDVSACEGLPQVSCRVYQENMIEEPPLSRHSTPKFPTQS